MNITLDTLKRLGACHEAREWFAATYPDGAVVLAATTLKACPDDTWVCWLAIKLSEPYRWWCATQAFRYAARVNPTLKKWARVGINANNWREARAAADAAYAAYAAYAADAYAAYAADAYAAYAAYAADADNAVDARRRAWKKLRAEAERVLLTLEGGDE